MNNDYFNYTKCVNDLTLVLSIGHAFKFNSSAIEKRIIKSEYFSLFNGDLMDSKSYITTKVLVKEIFPEITFDSYPNTFVELEWVSMMYINLISKTNFNFETLFTYINIDEACKMFNLYHEQDFSASYKRFIELYKKDSIIKRRMRLYNKSNSEISNETGISQSMIDALKNRRRDIKKLDVVRALKLANAINVKIDTLLNN